MLPQMKIFDLAKIYQQSEALKASEQRRALQLEDQMMQKKMQQMKIAEYERAMKADDDLANIYTRNFRKGDAGTPGTPGTAPEEIDVSGYGASQPKFSNAPSGLEDLMRPAVDAGLPEMMQSAESKITRPGTAGTPGRPATPGGMDMRGALNEMFQNPALVKQALDLQSKLAAQEKGELVQVPAGGTLLQQRGGTVTPLYTAPADPGKEWQNIGGALTNMRTGEVRPQTLNGQPFISPDKQAAIDLKREKEDQRKQEVKEKADVAKQQSIQSGLDKFTNELNKTNLPVMEGALRDVNNLLAPYKPKSGEKANVPGVGVVLSAIPDFFVSEKGQELRQAVAKITNIKLHDRSGAAVTSQELERFKQEIGLAWGKDANALYRGIESFQKEYNRLKQNILAGERPEVLDLYKERGGDPGLLDWGQKKTQAAGLTQEQNAWIDGHAKSTGKSRETVIQELKSKGKL